MRVIFAATVQQSIAILVAVAIVVGWGLYLLANLRRAKPEIGSEVELAANRKPYLDDEALEGPRLERALTWGLVALAICGVGLPLYWLAEPGRQAGAVEDFNERLGDVFFIHGQPIGGGALFSPTADGGFNCAGCHGGMEGLGATVPYTLTDPVTNSLRQVQWQAPSLNDVTLRMTDEQIRKVLVYGRPFSPMPAWGLDGGGPLNDQQLDNLILYLHRIAITPDEARKQNTDKAEKELERLRSTGVSDATMGQALFNVSCARCHTKGWSYGEPELPGGGFFGPSLYNVTEQFPAIEEHLEFVADGAEIGEQYGVGGFSDGNMPYFGQVLTAEQIQAIVDYERGLAESAGRQEGRDAAPPPGGEGEAPPLDEQLAPGGEGDTPRPEAGQDPASAEEGAPPAPGA
ncbi:MAG: cytochrome c [Actinobacteria bacterium]|nr:cytochrome c [Actinomycetota bacterium]